MRKAIVVGVDAVRLDAGVAQSIFIHVLVLAVCETTQPQLLRVDFLQKFRADVVHERDEKSVLPFVMMSVEQPRFNILPSSNIQKFTNSVLKSETDDGVRPQPITHQQQLFPLPITK